MRVRVVEPDEWEHLRTIRLRALAEDPAAFGARHEEESAFSEAQWRERATPSPTHATLVVLNDAGAWIGTCTLTVKGDEASLWAMWVAPEARGTGAARALIDACIERARAAGATHLTLWVNVAQERALSVYERAGFVQSAPPMRGTRDPSRLFVPMKRAV